MLEPSTPELLTPVKTSESVNVSEPSTNTAALPPPPAVILLFLITVLVASDVSFNWLQLMLLLSMVTFGVLIVHGPV